MNPWADIADAISAASGSPFTPAAPDGVGGGCISSAFRLSDREQSWFVKTNRADALAMFEAEAAGLDALADSQTIQTPRALCTGRSGGTSFIVMRYIEWGQSSLAGWREAGRQLAGLHRCNADHFGWIRDNTIGATHQANDYSDDWTSFWRDRRLGFQLEEAARNGYGGHVQSLGEQLRSRFDVLIDHDPGPSLLHGDLWGGNLAFDANGEAVIYDPATYYGDRETDLAMTELFGGFSPDFYAGYREVWPLDTGYRVRKQLYNLYHVLNHMNLFGGGYQAQAEQMMQSLLAEC